MEYKVNKRGVRCRYEWALLHDISINQLLDVNSKMISASYEMISPMPSDNKSNPYALNVMDLGNDDSAVCINGTSKGVQEIRKSVDWDLYGTWYFYKYPTVRNLKDLKSLSSKKVPRLVCYHPSEYFALPDEWQTIHHSNADIVVVKQGPNRLMVACIDSYNMYELLSNTADANTTHEKDDNPF